MLVLSQFHLRFGLRGFSSSGKNIQDQIGSVKRFYLKSFFDIGNLSSREFIIKQDDRYIVFLHIIFDFFQFPLSDKGTYMRMGEPLDKTFLRYNSYRQCQKGKRSEEHTSELQSRGHPAYRLLLQKQEE